MTIELISQEVVDSSAIEGEIRDRASVQSSLAKHLGFAADQRRASAAEAGAAEFMADVYHNHAAPLDDQALFAWHAMPMNGRRDIADVGHYRTHDDAMQIVSGALHAPRVHFEAPPSQAVPLEMFRFIAWFNASAPSSRTITRIRFLIAKTGLLDRLRGAINERQEKALLRLFRQGPDGFEGGLSAGNYRTITGASLATATRDLSDLVEKGALTRVGERRYTRYRLLFA